MNHYDNQVIKFKELAALVNGKLTLCNTHTSKGVKLPVGNINCKDCSFKIRDNFYGINLLISVEEESQFRYAYFYNVVDEDFYEMEMLRKRDYTFQHWTDVEINDPRILRVKTPKNYWSTVTGEEKDRWLNRFHSTEWYEKDWSGNYLIKDNERYYLAHRAFAEGMLDKSHLQPYKPGMKEFIIYIDNYQRTKFIMNLINSRND